MYLECKYWKRVSRRKIVYGGYIMWGDIAIAFMLSFMTSFVCVPMTIKLAKKVGAIDYPNERRVNVKPIPRIGGIAVIIGFLVAVIFLVITSKDSCGALWATKATVLPS